MYIGLACLGGISLGSNGAPGQLGLNLSMQTHKPAWVAELALKLYLTQKKLVKMNIILQNMLSATAILRMMLFLNFNRKFVE